MGFIILRLWPTKKNFKNNVSSAKNIYYGAELKIIKKKKDRKDPLSFLGLYNFIVPCFFLDDVVCLSESEKRILIIANNERFSKIFIV